MYDSNFYDIIRPGCISSANAVADVLGKVDTVIDVGCGEGHWGKAFCDWPTLVDYDGYESPKRAEGKWIKHDISETFFSLEKRYQLAICLEVAEHLPEEVANHLVTFLTLASDCILWSAAIPGQGGLNHINEQWPNYWINKFNDRGYHAEYIGWEFWGNKDVEPWYQQNLFLLKKSDEEFIRQTFTPFIHPAFWATKTGYDWP